MTLAYGLEVKKHPWQQIDYRDTSMHRIKLNPEKTKSIMFSRTLKETVNKPALCLHCIQLSYFPHSKFLGITFDHKFTFKKHFEDILEGCQQKYHRIRMLVSQKWMPSPQTILQYYKQCLRPIFEHGVTSTITVSDTVIARLQKLQNSFIRLALCLPRHHTITRNLGFTICH